MPPKLRRPAAVKPAAKPAPRRGVRLGVGLRRPAAEADQLEGERGATSEEEKFIAGELVIASKAPVHCLLQGTSLVVEGEYWSSPCKLCGVIKSLQIRSPSDLEVCLRVEGTTHEELLKWVTGNPSVPLRVHLCGEACEAKLDAKDLVHAKQVRLKKKEDEGTWADNLKGTVDELAALRREAEGVEPEKREDELKKEKKKKKKKKARREKSSESSSQGPDKAKGAKRRLSSQKELAAVYGSTGLDPDCRVRKRLLRRWKKKMKKKKESSSGSSGSSLEGSSQASILNSSDSGQVFEETHKVRRLARKAPGLLTFSMVKEMQRQLLTEAGTLWNTEKASVPPIALQYYRAQLGPRLSGGASREALTLCWALDMALQGKMAQVADCLSQRLKSLEMMAGGASWMVSQRVEIVPPERGRLSSRAEAQAAAKEEKLEIKTRQMTKGKEKGKTDPGAGPWRPSGKGDQKGKERGKGKKGNEKEEGKRNS